MVGDNTGGMVKLCGKESCLEMIKTPKLLERIISQAVEIHRIIEQFYHLGAPNAWN